MLGDLAFALRLHRRAPAFAVLVIVIFGAGIGVTATVFGLVHSILLRPLPFPESGRLVHLERLSTTKEDYNREVNEADFTRWRSEQTAFEDLAAFRSGTINVSDGQNPIRYNGAFISASFLRLLRVEPVIGRGFLPEDDLPGAPPVVLIGHRAWKEDFGGDPATVGRAVRINGVPGTIVGVLPDGFEFPINNQAWVPLRPEPLKPRDTQWSHEVFGRLRLGATTETAAAEFDTIASRIATEHEDAEGIDRVTLKPYREEFVGDGPRDVLTMMFILGMLVLLVSCFNVANLLLSRAAGRTREFSIRAALGASRWRIIRQMLVETLALALLGGVLGWCLTLGATAYLWRELERSSPPFFFRLEVDAVVTSFVFLVAAFAAFVAGILPAWRTTGGDLAATLKDGGRGSTSLHAGFLSRALVVLQVGLSAALLVVAGLLVVTMTEVYRVPLAFDPKAILGGRIGLFEGDYPDAASRAAFARRLEERMEAEPGVAATGATSRLRFQGTDVTRAMVEGEAYVEVRDAPLTRVESASAGVFAVLGVRILEGRGFQPTDVATSNPVAIVNQSFVRRFFPDGRALDRRIRVAGDDASGEPFPWLTVVGVCEDAFMEGIPSGFSQDVDGAGFYRPFEQAPTSFFTLLAKASGGDGALLATTLRRAVREIDSNLPAYFVETAEQSIDLIRVIWTFIVTVFLAFGVIALLLATAGLYGMTAFAVAQRRPEFGVRLALGAPPSSLAKLVLMQGTGQLALGLLPGLALGGGLAFALQNVLQELPLTNPLVYLLPALILAVATLAACAIPARRAAATDPMIALRSE